MGKKICTHKTKRKGYEICLKSFQKSLPSKKKKFENVLPTEKENSENRKLKIGQENKT